MDPNDLRTHVLVDSVKRLSKQASWYRRQGGRRANDMVRIANSLTDEARGQIAVLEERAKKGDEAARFLVDHMPTFGIQPGMEELAPSS